MKLLIKNVRAVNADSNEITDILIVDGKITYRFSEEQQAGKSIYQLSTRDGRNGTFIMLSTPEAVATANISVSQFIKPVCKIMGNSRVMPRRIDTVEEGKATLDGGVWRMLRKAVVAFES